MRNSYVDAVSGDSNILAEEAHRKRKRMYENGNFFQALVLIVDSKLFIIQEAAVLSISQEIKLFVAHFTGGSYLVPAFEGPFPFFQHKPLVLIGSLHIVLTDFQSLNDFPAVWNLEKNKNIVQCQN